MPPHTVVNGIANEWVVGNSSETNSMQQLFQGLKEENHLEISISIYIGAS